MSKYFTFIIFLLLKELSEAGVCYLDDSVSTLDTEILILVGSVIEKLPTSITIKETNVPKLGVTLPQSTLEGINELILLGRPVYRCKDGARLIRIELNARNLIIRYPPSPRFHILLGQSLPDYLIDIIRIEIDIIRPNHSDKRCRVDKVNLTQRKGSSPLMNIYFRKPENEAFDTILDIIGNATAEFTANYLRSVYGEDLIREIQFYCDKHILGNCIY